MEPWRSALTKLDVVNQCRAGEQSHRHRAAVNSSGWRCSAMSVIRQIHTGSEQTSGTEAVWRCTIPVLIARRRESDSRRFNGHIGMHSESRCCHQTTRDTESASPATGSARPTLASHRGGVQPTASRGANEATPRSYGPLPTGSLLLSTGVGEGSGRLPLPGCGWCGVASGTRVREWLIRSVDVRG